MHPFCAFRTGSTIRRPSSVTRSNRCRQFLVDRGFLVSVDGLFRDATEQAACAFQRAPDLLDDGIIGPRTWAALEGQPPPDANAVNFPTTFPPDHAGLSAELVEAGKYRDFAVVAASRYELPLCLVAGVASRESAWGLSLRAKGGSSGTGDFASRAPRPPMRTALPAVGGGFGRGLMQNDYDGHEFARSGNGEDPAVNTVYGAGVLSQVKVSLSHLTALAGVALWQALLPATLRRRQCYEGYPERPRHRFFY
jgi:hypothetical protein